MSFHVQWQMVASWKWSWTHGTLERFLTGVLAVVARELVRTGKLPAAAVPRASVRLLARVRPLVSLEVRALRVDLIAAGEVAAVDATAVRAGGHIAVLEARVVCNLGGKRGCIKKTKSRKWIALHWLNDWLPDKLLPESLRSRSLRMKGILGFEAFQCDLLWH